MLPPIYIHFFPSFLTSYLIKREATNQRPKNSKIEYRRYHNERSTWSHFLDVGSITQEEYLKAMARYTRDDEDEEVNALTHGFSNSILCSNLYILYV